MNNCVDVNDTVPLDSLMRYVLPTISNIPNALGVDLLRDAFRELAAESEMLSTIISLDTQKDVTDYEIPVPDGYVIHRIRELGYKHNWQDYRTANANYWYTSYDVAFKVIGNRTIILRDSPTHDEAGAYQLRCVVMPDECVARIPREVSTLYGKGIAAGALAEAFMYRTKPWYDPSLSRQKRQEYERTKRMAKNTQIVNRGASPANMKGRRWV